MLFLFFVVGLFIGSFLNVVIERTQRGESFVFGRSHCLSCGHKLAISDLIPVLSFLFYRGRCRYCHKKISYQYLLMELVTGLLFSLVYYAFANSIGLWQIDNQAVYLIRNFFLAAILLVVFVYDLKYMLIPDKITIPAIVVVFLLNIIFLGSWKMFAVSGLLSGCFSLFQFVLSRGRWVGGGDIRLGVLLGVALGWPYFLVALMLSYVGGAIISIFLILRRRKGWGSKIPFGTFLSAATLITLFLGQYLSNWYWNLIMF